MLKESLQHMSQPHAVREPAITLADAAADFDLILTLPLPEAKLVGENEVSSCDSFPAAVGDHVSAPLGEHGVGGAPVERPAVVSQSRREDDHNVAH